LVSIDGLGIIVAVPRLAFRGPFLLLFALDQQLGSLLTRALADAPLRPGEFAVYSTLRLEQPTTPSVLATTLGLRATTMSSQLARMSTLGHLERTRNPRDGRSTLLSLTPEGLAATEACFAGFSRAIQLFRKHLTTDEPAVLVALEAVGTALTGALQEIGDEMPSVDAQQTGSDASTG
jgi:DNA-binding MarR family transcriptional regulator